MKLSSALLAATLSVATYASPVKDQQPLNANGDSDLINELMKAEIIPTVLNTFKPYLTLSVSWKKATAEIGNTIKPKKVQDAPDVHFVDTLPDFASTWTESNHPQLTLALTDPDARSRDNPDWSEMCHWIATDIPLSAVGALKSGGDYTDIIPYKAPGPPKKTGKHRYVFAALAPANGTFEKLNLTTPADRQHWGYGEERTGLRRWATENGLAVVGANFIYAQHKKQ